MSVKLGQSSVTDSSAGPNQAQCLLTQLARRFIQVAGEQLKVELENFNSILRSEFLGYIVAQMVNIQKIAVSEIVGQVLREKGGLLLNVKFPEIVPRRRRILRL